MSKKELRRIIKGQDVAFDTHQAGDSQNVHVEHLHLEKRLHGGRGKARFPLFGDIKPSSSRRMSATVLNDVTNEVSKALRKDETLTKELAQTIVNVLKRFRNGNANANRDIHEEAREAAKRIASYFDLDDEFLMVVENYSKGTLICFMTIHFNQEDGTLHEIAQSADSVGECKSFRVNKF